MSFIGFLRTIQFSITSPFLFANLFLGYLALIYSELTIFPPVSKGFLRADDLKRARTPR